MEENLEGRLEIESCAGGVKTEVKAGDDKYRDAVVCVYSGETLFSIDCEYIKKERVTLKKGKVKLCCSKQRAYKE